MPYIFILCIEALHATITDADGFQYQSQNIPYIFHLNSKLNDIGHVGEYTFHARLVHKFFTNILGV